MNMTLYAPRIIEVDTVPMTTSLAIAEHFDKEHKNVVRDIRAEIERQEDFVFSSQHFLPFQHVDARGKSQPIYRLTELGFSLIVMGFTGQKASKWKRAYAETFMGMREQIKSDLKLDLVNRQYALEAKDRRILSLTDSYTRQLTEANAQINDLQARNEQLQDMTVQLSCYPNVEMNVQDNRMQILQLLRQSRLDWLTLRETKTRYVIDPNRVSNAETVLRLTYALSKGQAAVLWLLLGMGEGANEVTLSTLSMFVLLGKTGVSQSSIQRALEKLSETGYIRIVHPSDKSTPRSYWVNVAKVVGCLRDYEQVWLHADKYGQVTGAPVAGLTDVEGFMAASNAKEWLIPKTPVDRVSPAKDCIQPSTQFYPETPGIGSIKPELGSDGKAWVQ